MSTTWSEKTWGQRLAAFAVGTRVELNFTGKQTFVRAPHYRSLRGTVTKAPDAAGIMAVRRDTQQYAQRWHINNWTPVADAGLKEGSEE